MRNFLAVFMVAALAFALAAPAMAQPKSGALMEADVFTPLTLGFDYMRDGKYDAAEMEFKKVLKADEFNPFALNNLAALEERKGNLDTANAYLTDAGRYADQYRQRVQETCFVGGLCTAVRPGQEAGAQSEIVKVIAENQAKLRAKMGPGPRPPQSAPKM
jgi:lipopolysaccharide biosynthesis regulator YciM